MNNTENSNEKNRYIPIDDRYVEIVCKNGNKEVTCIAEMENLGSSEFCEIIHNVFWAEDSMMLLDEEDLFDIVAKNGRCVVRSFYLDLNNLDDSVDCGEISKWVNDMSVTEPELVLAIEGEIGLLTAIDVSGKVLGDKEGTVIYSVFAGKPGVLRVTVLAFE